ncbi:hypothetical protein Bbelb_078730 [Branchiostoma belcheri]|nr:hypothetical protein Bbelb_078730 [Branchiostoma belcheri]
MKPGGTHWFSTVKALIGASKPRGNSMPATDADTNAQCESFSEHFASVWTNVRRVTPSLTEVGDQLSQRSIPELSIGQVKAKLRSVNPRKATGGDHIPPWVLSTFFEELAPVMCSIYNVCLQQGVFPSVWKEELVVPVPKTTKPKGPEEFRRISMTSSLGKVLEMILRDLLLQDTNDLIHNSQHGFRRARSTVSALIHTTQSWYDAVNSVPKMDVHVAFIDFTRAFDTIDHGSLLRSLSHMGIRHDLWRCLCSYLSGRVQRVKWGTSISEARPVLAGGIDKVDAWANSFCMSANAKKTKDMVISCRRSPVVPPPLTLNGESVERVTSFKLPGIVVSNDLKWGPHVEYMLAKVQPRIHYLRVARRAALPTEVLLQIYKSFIRPVLEYGSPVWAGLPRCLSDEVERVQKLCLRICGVLRGYLPTLECRRREASLRELKRILQDPTNPCNDFIPPRENTVYNLRKNSNQFKLPLSRSDRHKNSFIVRAVKDL